MIVHIASIIRHDKSDYPSCNPIYKCFTTKKIAKKYLCDKLVETINDYMYDYEEIRFNEGWPRHFYDYLQEDGGHQDEPLWIIKKEYHENFKVLMEMHKYFTDYCLPYVINFSINSCPLEDVYSLED